MEREALFTKLREAKTVLKSLGVESMAVFGSVARGDYSEGSDIDILVVFYRPVGLFEFVRLKHYLEQITHCKIDLVTPDALRPDMKERILKEAVNVR